MSRVGVAGGDGDVLAAVATRATMQAAPRRLSRRPVLVRNTGPVVRSPMRRRLPRRCGGTWDGLGLAALAGQVRLALALRWPRPSMSRAQVYEARRPTVELVGTDKASSDRDDRFSRRG
jgi:hypothetical protein